MKNKVSRDEELDYANKRLAYINDLYRYFCVNGDRGKRDNIISTDEVVSLFDGGYRLGLMDLRHKQKYEFEKFHYFLTTYLRQLLEELVGNNSMTDETRIAFKEIEKILVIYQESTKGNFNKLFDSCEQSNKNTVENVEERERNEEFLDHLYRTYER